MTSKHQPIVRQAKGFSLLLLPTVLCYKQFPVLTHTLIEQMEFFHNTLEAQHKHSRKTAANLHTMQASPLKFNTGGHIYF